MKIYRKYIFPLIVKFKVFISQLDGNKAMTLKCLFSMSINITAQKNTEFHNITSNKKTQKKEFFFSSQSADEISLQKFLNSSKFVL